METTVAIRQRVVVQKGGVIQVQSPELKPGTSAEVIILMETTQTVEQKMTAGDLLDSGLIGLWASRSDLGDSLTFAQRLRRRAENRED